MPAGVAATDPADLITSATQDHPQITSDWQLRRSLIADVRLQEVKHVVTGNGITTELWRPDWDSGLSGVEQCLHVRLNPGATSAWHLHRGRNDGVFVVSGSLRLVLFDPRRSSPTVGQVDVLHLSHVRPTLVVIPTSVWHGLQAIGGGPASFVNWFDRPYDHDDPDEWRLPADTSEIPYTFA